MDDLEFTGERLTTSLEVAHGVIEHLHRYALAQKITIDKIVLDIASGEGYGSFLLSKTANKVYGVDIDENSINYAKAKYGKSENINFLVGSTDAIPLDDNSVDIVVSFETLEHHDKHDLMMQEIVRVLKKDGVLLLSSPEKSIYNERDPNNKFHVKELSIGDFEILLKKYFKEVTLFSQRFVIGSLIHLVDKKNMSKFNLFDGNYSQIKNELVEDSFYNKPYFNLAICTNSNRNDFSEIGFSFFNGVNVIKKEMNEYKFKCEKKYNEIVDSESFKIGNNIVKKINYCIKFWKK
ncbi:hypothetical protein GCM10008015_31770 [Flavobacterium palustre]|uniref:Methyltransferase type 11 domain-containing protein n=1 Tax=Flavobacterium palustre TaxID=1476463 RepID=A0ABQ1HSY9_9FLAO|nr:class I SAM-dependent methyltransferase [Flavobacterium palustre]GGA88875.1 hypothetical protein GCM10008015_31770 [Flavobacterium palustre]